MRILARELRQWVTIRDGLQLLEVVQSQQGSEEVKIAAVEGAVDLYRDFVQLLLDLHLETGDARYLHEAFRYNETLRARIFLEILGKSRVTRLGGELGALAAREAEMRRQMAQLHRQLRAPNLQKPEESRLLDQVDGLRASWRALKREAAHQSPRYGQVIFPSAVTVADVQSVLLMILWPS